MANNILFILSYYTLQSKVNYLTMIIENLKTDVAQTTPDFSFFLFVNTSSGGKKGTRFIDLQIQIVKFYFNPIQVNVSFYDLVQEKSRDRGLNKLKQANMKKEKCRAIVCGGDGTVLWVIKQIVKYGIPIQNIPIGIIPIGTGNDFSRHLGWGGEQRQMIGKKFDTLKRLIMDWMDAEVENFDLWDMKFQVFENGFLKRMKGSTSQPLNETQYTDKAYIRSFTNYCSFGGDGRVGYSFDKYRTNYRALNLLAYACIGLAKICKKLDNIDSVVQKMEMDHDDLNLLEETKFIKTVDTTQIKLIEKKHQSSKLLGKDYHHKEIIFDVASQDRRIEEGFQNLLALNINSFMGGASGMWDTQKIGLNYEQKFKKQSSNDGLIEFLSWKGEIAMGMERIYHNASKIAQGNGAFTITFKQNKQQLYYTYLQVDGEYFKVVHPKCLTIKKSELTPGGIIKVLRKRNDK